MVETAHIYIRLLEHYCRDNKHMVVQERRRKGKKKKRSKGSGGNAALLSHDQLIDQWEIMDARCVWTTVQVSYFGIDRSLCVYFYIQCRQKILCIMWDSWVQCYTCRSSEHRIH